MYASSVMITPRPWHSSQAPFELKLNIPASTPLAFANSFRTGSIRPMYVAGVERDDAGIGDWSTNISSGYKPRNDSEMSELLPEPATPVTTVSTPMGTSTETFLRLWSDAFR